MVVGSQIAETVQSFVGTPYGHRGRIPGKALDCVGVVVCAAGLHHLEVREPDLYTVPQRISVTMEQVEDSLRKVLPYERQSGDIVVLNYGRGLAHIVVDVGGNRCVEACAIRDVRKVIERPFPDGRPVLGTFRIPGVE